MAARGRAGTWGLGRAVSSELWRYREFFGDAGISGYLATQFRPQALEERGMVVVVAEAVLAPWGACAR